MLAAFCLSGPSLACTALMLYHVANPRFTLIFDRHKFWPERDDSELLEGINTKAIKDPLVRTYIKTECLIKKSLDHETNSSNAPGGRRRPMTASQLAWFGGIRVSKY